MIDPYILQKRLDGMLYVGLTENHRESATMFANVVGAQVISQFTALGSSTKFVADNNSGQFCKLFLAQRHALFFVRIYLIELFSR